MADLKAQETTLPAKPSRPKKSRRLAALAVFAREYVLTNNAAAACRKAFPGRDESKHAYNLMCDPDVVELIAQERAMLRKEYELTRDRIMGQHANVGLANITDFIDPETFELYAPDKLKELPRHITDAIAEMHAWTDQFGQRHVKIKLHPKLGHLDSAAKIQGLYKDTPDVQTAIFITKGLE